MKNTLLPARIYATSTLAVGLLLLFAPAALAEGHRFACADYIQGKVFIVGTDGKVEWEYSAPSCNELWVLPDGNLLFTTGHGVQVPLNFDSRDQL